MPGVYRIRNLAYEVIAVVTNKAPVAPYRGVGWTAGHCARELLIDRAARELGLDPAELRRRNMVRPEEFPYESCTGMLYDSGSFTESLDLALEAVGYHGFRAEQQDARRSGRLLGIGVSPYVEPTGWGTEGSAQASWVLVSHDAARVTLEPSGEVSVAIGTPSQGQGHQTTIAQLAADVLGVDIADVTLIANDTAATPISIPGTRASRTAVVLGGAVLKASTELRGRVLAVAGFLLEADPGDLEIVDGGVALRDAPSRSVTLKEIAEAAYFRPGVRAALTEPDLSVSSFHDPRATYANGCIVAVVEVEHETGQVTVRRIVAVEDCGTMINPDIVEGQVRGAVAQGIGGALLEQVAYDEEGQPQTSTLMDYLLPSATEVPPIQVEHCVSPSPFTPGGIKGMGESGLIATPAALANAVADALEPFDARIDRLPLTPELVSELLTP
jgi:carbon-monoxide dehydrogenase large subunit